MSLEYHETLKSARAVGASNANDAEATALFCESVLQQLCGAVSPKLVFDGAQAQELSFIELTRLAQTDPMAVADLMWA